MYYLLFLLVVVSGQTPDYNPCRTCTTPGDLVPPVSTAILYTQTYTPTSFLMSYTTNGATYYFEQYSGITAGVHYCRPAKEYCPSVNNCKSTSGPLPGQPEQTCSQTSSIPQIYENCQSIVGSLSTKIMCITCPNVTMVHPFSCYYNSTYPSRLFYPIFDVTMRHRFSFSNWGSQKQCDHYLSESKCGSGTSSIVYARTGAFSYYSSTVSMGSYQVDRFVLAPEVNATRIGVYRTFPERGYADYTTFSYPVTALSLYARSLVDKNDAFFLMEAFSLLVAWAQKPTTQFLGAYCPNDVACPGATALGCCFSGAGFEFYFLYRQIFYTDEILTHSNLYYSEADVISTNSKSCVVRSTRNYLVNNYLPLFKNKAYLELGTTYCHSIDSAGNCTYTLPVININVDAAHYDTSVPIKKLLLLAYRPEKPNELCYDIECSLAQSQTTQYNYASYVAYSIIYSMLHKNLDDLVFYRFFLQDLLQHTIQHQSSNRDLFLVSVLVTGNFQSIDPVTAYSVPLTFPLVKQYVGFNNAYAMNTKYFSYSHDSVELDGFCVKHYCYKPSTFSANVDLSLGQPLRLIEFDGYACVLFQLQVADSVVTAAGYVKCFNASENVVLGSYTNPASYNITNSNVTLAGRMDGNNGYFAHCRPYCPHHYSKLIYYIDNMTVYTVQRSVGLSPCQPLEIDPVHINFPTFNVSSIPVSDNISLVQEYATGIIVEHTTGAIWHPSGIAYENSYYVRSIIRYALPDNCLPVDFLTFKTCVEYICSDSALCAEKAAMYCGASEYYQDSFAKAKAALLNVYTLFNHTLDLLLPPLAIEIDQDTPQTFGVDDIYATVQKPTRGSLPSTSSAYFANLAYSKSFAKPFELPVSPGSGGFGSTGASSRRSSISSISSISTVGSQSPLISNWRVRSSEAANLNININSKTGSLPKTSKLAAIGSFFGSGLSLVDFGLSIFSLVEQRRVAEITQLQIAELADSIVLLADTTFASIHNLELAVNSIGTYLAQFSQAMTHTVEQIQNAFNEFQEDTNDALYYTNAAATYGSSMSYIISEIQLLQQSLDSALNTFLLCITASSSGIITPQCLPPDQLQSLLNYTKTMIEHTNCTLTFGDNYLQYYNIPLITEAQTFNGSIFFVYNVPVTCTGISGTLVTIEPGYIVERSSHTALKYKTPTKVSITNLGFFEMDMLHCDTYNNVHLCDLSAFAVTENSYLNCLTSGSCNVPLDIAHKPDPCKQTSPSSVWCYYSDICDNCHITAGCNETKYVTHTDGDGVVEYVIKDIMCEHFPHITATIPVFIDPGLNANFGDLPPLPVHTHYINMTFNFTLPPEFDWDNLTLTANFTEHFLEMRKNISDLADQIFDLTDWGKNLVDSLNEILSSIFNIPLGLATFIIAVVALSLSGLLIFFLLFTSFTKSKID